MRRLAYRTHLVVDQRETVDVREQEKHLVLRVVHLGRRNVRVDAVDLLDLTGGRALPANAWRLSATIGADLCAPLTADAVLAEAHFRVWKMVVEVKGRGRWFWRCEGARLIIGRMRKVLVTGAALINRTSTWRAVAQPRLNYRVVRTVQPHLSVKWFFG